MAFLLETPLFTLWNQEFTTEANVLGSRGIKMLDCSQRSEAGYQFLRLCWVMVPWPAHFIFPNRSWEVCQIKLITKEEKHIINQVSST